ncbi:hypothetical protein C6P44_000026 [Monosporozyma unispora]|nr:hypothetical protein C6P44_000026 [Kazachstania unispora]
MLLNYVLPIISFLQFTYANTEIWKLDPSNAIMLNNTSIKPDNNIIPLQINTIPINNISQPNIISFPLSTHPIYIKLSWSAIDPIDNFKILQLYSIVDNKTMLISLNTTLSHSMNYTEQDPLLINLYISNTGSLLTHDLHNIIYYITGIVILLTILYWKFDGVKTLLLHNIL